MNPIQDAIARIAGLDDEFAFLQNQLEEVATVNEGLLSATTMLERQIEDMDYLNLYETNEIIEVLPIKDRRKTIARLRRLRHDNPLAKQAVKLVVRFTLGKGIQWILADEAQENSGPDTEVTATSDQTPNPKPTQAPVVKDTQGNDQIRGIIEDFWRDKDNKLAFTTRQSMRQFLDDIVTDGEKFFGCFEGNSEPFIKVSEIPIEQIVQIIYHPDNALKPVYYKRQYNKLKYDGDNDQYVPDGNPRTEFYLDYRITDEDLTEIGNRIRIPKSKINKDAKIFHVGINWLKTKNGRRGISDLYASREWFRVFREFMEGRAAINAAAQAISYVRKVKGGPTAVAQFSGKFGGLDVGDTDANATEPSKLTKPIKGAVYDSNEGVDLQWFKTDTGAQNAKEDARMLLMAAGSGVSTFIHYFGEGGDANLATAQSMELPMVKSYEEWQQFVEDFLLEMLEYVIRVATDEETAEEEVIRVGFTFPPIISQDVVKYTTSWAQIVRDIAPNVQTIKEEAIRAVLTIMQVPNIDGIMPEVLAELQAAEEHRKAQTAELLKNLGDGQQPPPGENGSRPPVAGQTPNAGLPPDTKHLVATGQTKNGNGPKPA